MPTAPPHDSTSVLALTHSCALDGVAAYTVRVEARLAPGLPRMVVVSLPDAAVHKGRERVRAALRLTGVGRLDSPRCWSTD